MGRATCSCWQLPSAHHQPTTHDQFDNLLFHQVNVVYKFGGSSVRDAERMLEVADIICSFPDLLPCVVLSAMGKVCLLVRLPVVSQRS
jgi:hypothetical protein